MQTKKSISNPKKALIFESEIGFQDLEIAEDNLRTYIMSWRDGDK